MAGADEKLTDRSYTTTTTGTHIMINIPDAGSPTGFTSYRITYAAFLATNNAAIATLQAYDAQAPVTVKEQGKSGNFTNNLSADTKLESIDIIWVSGTPTVKVGTSAGTGNIISGRTPTSGNPSMNILDKYWVGATTLYFTISSGTVDIIINKRENYNS